MRYDIYEAKKIFDEFYAAPSREELELAGLMTRELAEKAIEQALERVPVRNGVARVHDLWLETAIPKDLIIELLKENEIRFPPHVKRVELR